MVPPKDDEESESGEAEEQTDRHENITVEIGGRANPPGFDEQLMNLSAGDSKSFDVVYPSDYTIAELAGTTVKYEVSIKAVRRRVVPDLDDELAKDIGEFQSLDALRGRVRADLEHEATHESEREMRSELLKQLAARVAFDVPVSLVDREVDRRVEEFVRRLIEQQIDPMRTNINWEEFRERQKDAASEAVKSALVLDEVARREGLAATDDEVEAEVQRYAERTGRSVPAVRARLEKEGGLGRVHSGLRREKTVNFMMSKATVIKDR
jgi:trigger factor